MYLPPQSISSPLGIQGRGSRQHGGDGVPLGVLFINDLFFLGKSYLHDLAANTSLKKLYKKRKGCYYNILEKLENEVYSRHLILLLIVFLNIWLFPGSTYGCIISDERLCIDNTLSFLGHCFLNLHERKRQWSLILNIKQINQYAKQCARHWVNIKQSIKRKQRNEYASSILSINVHVQKICVILYNVSKKESITYPLQ